MKPRKYKSGKQKKGSAKIITGLVLLLIAGAAAYIYTAPEFDRRKSLEFPAGQQNTEAD